MRDAALSLVARLGRAAVLAAALAAPLAAQAAPEPADSPRLELVRQRGALIVGVKTDYPPFGFLRPDGSAAGLEHDMAVELARRLGVRLVKVGVTGANRLQRLQEGSIDIVVATTGDTMERRQVATMVEPHYYASGVTLFMPPGPPPADWGAIRGQVVCATQGSYYNRAMAERYLLQLDMYNNARDAKLAVRDRRCIGYLFDNTAVHADLRTPEWAGYQAPLPPALVTPWAIALAASERGTRFERFVADTVADWHRSGWLLEREQAWGLPPSQFLADMHALWTRRGADGAPVCARRGDGQWAEECRNRVFLSSTEATGLRQAGLWLRERTGVDLNVVYDGYDRRRFLLGLATTLALTIACVAGSLALGVAGALLAGGRHRWLGWLVRAGATVGRMTPPLLLIYLVLFGLGTLLLNRHGLALAPWAVVVGCLSAYTGSSVMVALLDAAAARRHADPGFQLRRDTLAQVLPLASPAVTSALTNVSKATMMASAVAVPEIMSVATSIMTDSGNVGVMMNLLLLTFFVLLFGVRRGLDRVDRRIRTGSWR